MPVLLTEQNNTQSQQKKAVFYVDELLVTQEPTFSLFEIGIGFIFLCLFLTLVLDFL